MAAQKTRLLPSPRKHQNKPGLFHPRDDTPIILLGAAPESVADELFDTALELREFLQERFSLACPIESHANTGGLEKRIELVYEDPTSPRANATTRQGYALSVTPKIIRIKGSSSAAVRYGVETLKQLWTASGRTALRACEIRDQPAFEMRGVLLDVSRGKVPKPETIVQFLDWMVSVKLNVLMLYTEHVFRFRRHPLIGKDASPYDAETMRRLDRHAKKNHIELIPTLQSLGHMQHVLDISRYASLAESKKKWSLSPAVEGTYELLSDLYDEYLPNFRSRWFNANCDEPVDLGHGRSKDWAARVGRGRVYRHHLDKIRALAAEHGRRTMIWGDVVHEHPDEIPKLDRRIVFLDWWYEDDHDFNRVRVFKKNGIEFLVCPGTSAWNSLFPRLNKAFANISGYARSGKRHGARGLINTDWGDNGHVNLLGNSRIAFAWGAELSWARREPERRAFERAFALHTYQDRSGTTSKILRDLGSLHNAGFDHFNNSSLKTVFFDSLDEAEFLSKVRKSPLERARQKIQSIAAAWERSSRAFELQSIDRLELEWAIDATQLAVTKALASQQYLEWREGKSRLTGKARRDLSKRFEELAEEQSRLRTRLRRLWLSQNQPNDFRNLRARFSRSIRSLRKAARKLNQTE